MRKPAIALLVTVGLVGACASESVSGDEPSLDDEDGEDYDGYAPKADSNNGLGGPLSRPAPPARA